MLLTMNRYQVSRPNEYQVRNENKTGFQTGILLDDDHKTCFGLYDIVLCENKDIIIYSENYHLKPTRTASFLKVKLTTSFRHWGL